LHAFEVTPEPLMIVRPVADPPPAAVVDLPTAKAHLRVTTTAEDALVTLYVAAAQAAIVAYCEASVARQRWEALVGGVAGSHEPIVLPFGPVAAVVSVDAVPPSGPRVPVEGYTAAGPIVGPPSAGWPVAPNAVAIVYDAGPDVAPEPVQLATLLLIGQYYDHRAAVKVGTITQVMPYTVEWLLAPLRATTGVVPA
jgi:uncharacterized phiE125 gp8 family phage protein